MGLAGVAAGTAWAVGGVPALRTATVTALRLVPALLVAAGVLLALRAIVPRATLDGPLVLIAGGLLAMAFQFDVVTASVLNGIGPAALVLGGIMIAMSRRPDGNPTTAIVRRHWSIFLPNRQRPTGEAPHKFILRCVLGELDLDLTRASYPTRQLRITVDISVLAGLVEIRVPPGWTVRSGRLYLTRGTLFDGELSQPEPVREVAAGDEFGKNLVVLNVQGWRGRVVIHHDHSGVSPPPAPGLPESPAT